jgi:hypothetical protein
VQLISICTPGDGEVSVFAAVFMRISIETRLVHVKHSLIDGFQQHGRCIMSHILDVVPKCSAGRAER